MGTKILWLLDCVVAVFATFMCGVQTNNMWFVLVVALCFIFGPKIFRAL